MNRKEYLASLDALARSIVIHSPISALRLHQKSVYVDGQPDHDDKIQWKYYQNLAGLYYPTDVTMMVRSIDNGQDIIFDQESLEKHSVTKAAYSLKSSAYNELVRRYPDQKMLIDGILHPIDIKAAVKTDEGRILYADPRHIEQQEVSLLIELQEWIYSYLRRRTVRAYMQREEFFPAVRLAPLYACLPNEVDNIRLSKCKTLEVHSHYVLSHLGSRQSLDQQAIDLSWDTSLWLYRNIDDIRSRVGMNETFDLLVSKLLDEKQIDLVRYTLTKDESKMPDEPRPEIVLRRQDLKTHALGKEVELEELYRQWPERLQARIDSALRSGHSESWTRMLVSEMIDASVEGPETQHEYAIRHWLAYSLSDLIDGDQEISAPRNRSKITLTPQQAALAYLVCRDRYHGLETTQVGEHVYSGITRRYLPETTELMKLTSHPEIGADLIELFNRGHIDLPMRMSRPSFSRYIALNYIFTTKQRFFLSHIDDAIARAELEGVMRARYIDLRVLKDVKVDVIVERSQRQFMFGIEVTDYTQADYRLLLEEILDRFIDIRPDDRLVDMGRHHRASMQVLNKLTSYQTSIVLLEPRGRKVIADTPSPRLKGVQAIDLAVPRPPRLEPATIPETRAGIIDYKYVTPYTLRDSLERAEAKYVGHLNHVLAVKAHTFDIHTPR